MGVLGLGVLEFWVVLGFGVFGLVVLGLEGFRARVFQAFGFPRSFHVEGD